MFRVHTSFFDIMFILLAVFWLIIILLAKNVQQEYQTKVDMLKKDIERKNTEGPDADPVSLSVIQSSGDKYEYIIESKKLGKKNLDSVLRVKEELSKLRPARISLRIDKDVPTGITQEILYDAQNLGIIPYLAFEKGKGGA